MNAKVFAAINDQINSEFQSSYTYLAMSGFCDRQKFLGAAKWLRMQSEEERQHGLKLFDFVLARDGKVALKAIDQIIRPMTPKPMPIQIMGVGLKNTIRLTSERSASNWPAPIG